MPGASRQTRTPSKPHRVKPIITKADPQVKKRGLKNEVQSFGNHAQGVEAVPQGRCSIAECLHRAWASAKAQPVNDKRIAEAQNAAGVTEQVNTWAGWKAAGYEVQHGAKALFQAILIHASKGDSAVYKASFFGRSQVQPMNA